MGIEHIYFIKGWDASTMRHGLKNNDGGLRAAMAMACGAPQPEKPDDWQAWCDGIARDLLDGVLRNVPLAHRPAADDVSRAIARRLWSKPSAMLPVELQYAQLYADTVRRFAQARIFEGAVSGGTTRDPRGQGER